MSPPPGDAPQRGWLRRNWKRKLLATLGVVILLGAVTPLLTMAVIADANARHNRRVGAHQRPDSVAAVLVAKPRGLAILAGLVALGCTCVVVAAISRDGDRAEQHAVG